jgi:hypothetical protein
MRVNFHMAGATSPQHRQHEHATESVLQILSGMIKAIREAGRTPVQRNTIHESIRVLKNSPGTNEAEPPPAKPIVFGRQPGDGVKNGNES